MRAFLYLDHNLTKLDLKTTIWDHFYTQLDHIFIELDRYYGFFLKKQDK